MTITKYVSQQIKIANESVDADPSEGAVGLFRATGAQTDEHGGDWFPASNDLNGLVEALGHAAGVSDTARIALIGDALRGLAREVEAASEIEAGPPTA